MMKTLKQLAKQHLQSEEQAFKHPKPFVYHGQKYLAVKSPEPQLMMFPDLAYPTPVWLQRRVEAAEKADEKDEKK